MSITSRVSLVSSLMVMSLPVGLESAVGQRSFGLEQSVQAADTGQWHRFGDAVAVFEDSLLVGASRHDGNGSSSGAASFFEHDGVGWSGEQRVFASDGQPDDWFGDAVAIRGDLAVVGARRADQAAVDAGAAYVFRRQAGIWAEEQILLPGLPAAGGAFGVAVAVGDDEILVGAQSTATGPAGMGAVFLYRHDGVSWSLAQEWTPSDGASDDAFGSAIAIEGRRALIGAPGGRAAYLFEEGTTQWEQRSRVEGDTEFGRAVAISGERAVIGRLQFATTYTLDDGGLVLDEELESVFGDFGFAVAIAGDAILVGAPGKDQGGCLISYVHRDESWQLQTMFLDLAGYGARLGDSVAMHGARAVAGAPLFADPAVNAGAVFSFAGRTPGCGVENVLQSVGEPFGRLDRFGEELVAEGDRAFAGAPGNGTFTAGVGHVGVLQRGADGVWSLDAELDPGDLVGLAGFGTAMDLEGDLLVVGAPFDGALRTGTVYLYGHDGTSWQVQQKLFSPAPEEDAFFGQSLALDGDTLVVGSPSHGDDQEGAVFVFERIGGVFQFQQLLEIPFPFLRFGESVDVDGDRLIVGTSREDLYAGAAHVYHRVGGAWVPVAQLRHPVPGIAGAGAAVRIAGDLAIVGAPRAEVDGRAEAGNVLVFRWNGVDWLLHQTLISGLQRWQPGFGRHLDLDAAGGRLLIGSNWESSLYLLDGGGSFVESTRLVGELGAGMDDWPLRHRGAVALAGDDLLVGEPFAAIAAPGRVDVYRSSLGLDVHPAAVLPGDRLTMQSCGGAAGGLLYLAIVAVNDNPIFFRVALDLYDADGRWERRLSTPPGLRDTRASFLAFGFRPGGRLEASRVAEVVFR